KARRLEPGLISCGRRADYLRSGNCTADIGSAEEQVSSRLARVPARPANFGDVGLMASTFFLHISCKAREPSDDSSIIRISNRVEECAKKARAILTRQEFV